MGVDRLVMLRYGVADVRELYTADLRIVNQF
jgi:phenylalanyl-tRNA synthetase alpha subunit